MDANATRQTAIAAVRSILLPDLVLVADLAKHLGLSRHVVRTLLKRGELPGRKIGGRWVVPRPALLAWLSMPEQLTHPEEES